MTTDYVGPGLMLYSDAACTKATRAPQAFTQANALDFGVYGYYQLTKLTAAELGRLYKRSGSSAPVLLNPNATPPDYTVSDQTQLIRLNVGLLPSEILYALPTDHVEVTLAGIGGVSRQVSVPLWLKRMSTKTYGDLLVMLADADVTGISITAAGITASLVGGYTQLSGFSNLPGGLIGCAVMYAGQCIGRVSASTVSTVVVDSTVFASVIPSEVRIISAAAADFALEDEDGTVGPYAPVLAIPVIDDTTPVLKLWMREAYTIPTASAAYPNTYVRILGTEFSTE